MRWLAEADLFGYDTHLPGWAAIPIFVIIWGLLTYAFLVFSQRFIGGIVFAPGRRAFEVTLKATHIPLVVLFGLLGAKVALDSRAFPSRVQEYGGFVLISALAGTLVFAAARLVGAFLDELATRYPGFTALHTPIHYIARVLILLVGVLMWMQAVGIPVTALLGTAGIAGAAAVLGMQDTLRNFAAGIHLVLDRPFHIGDAVTLEDGTTATVMAIGWRSVRLRRADQSVLIIPNRTIAEQKVINHSVPQKWIVVSLPVRLPREADLGHVETLLRDELARAAEDIAALRKEPPPSVSPLPGYLATHLELTIGFTVSDFKSQRPVSGEVLRRVYDRLRTEGVAFASPRSPVA